MFWAAMMAYKTVRATHQVRKSVHMLVHLLAIVLAIVGISAAFKYHDMIYKEDVYSLHSWIGITTICMYCLQVTTQVLPITVFKNEKLGIKSSKEQKRLPPPQKKKKKWPNTLLVHFPNFHLYIKKTKEVSHICRWSLFCSGCLVSLHSCFQELQFQQEINFCHGICVREGHSYTWQYAQLSQGCWRSLLSCSSRRINGNRVCSTLLDWPFYSLASLLISRLLLVIILYTE